MPETRTEADLLSCARRCKLSLVTRCRALLDKVSFGRIGLCMMGSGGRGRSASGCRACIMPLSLQTCTTQHAACQRDWLLKCSRDTPRAHDLVPCLPVQPARQDNVHLSTSCRLMPSKREKASVMVCRQHGVLGRLYSLHGL